jgi:alcohol dehydrogenase
VSLNANPLTEAFSLRALALIGRALPRAAAAPDDLAARADMVLANTLGGAALNAGVGCAHILAHPLGATFGIPHGAAIAAVLPQVFDANASYAPAKYEDIHRALDPEGAVPSPGDGSRAGDALRALLQRIGFAPRLAEHGVTPDAFDTLYEGVEKSMRHVVTNPRPATRELLLDILKRSL